MIRTFIRGVMVATIILFGMRCSQEHDRRFSLVPSAASGITFKNTLTESPDFNIFNYMYFYNGGGVAAGDINGDSLPDIYFTANQEPNKLYLNTGGFKFKDITEAAGVEGFKGWTTGVTMADVNSDGRLDIYVSYLGDHQVYKGRNQLFINEGVDANGIPRFKDRAMEFGLDLVGFSTQAAFFDYDRDGDLDMFMLNHSVHENGTFGRASLRRETHPLAGDRLLRNDNGRFVDVTQSSGIYSSVIGYGLGVVAGDINLDGWPDIYVGNDFHENDYLYINQGDGTFKEVIEQMMNHTSRYTMGIDLADFNNDAFPDVIAMDMLPEDPTVLKSSAAEDPYDVYDFKISYGFNHQFARNTLQVNNQDGTFSEVGLYAGVAATDWSWATLFADFDLDGAKDIFISNGIFRRPNDLDYINFITVDSIQLKMKHDMSEKELAYIKKMPHSKVPNYLYHNNGDSTFTNVAPAWGLDKPSCSHGAAYADLDNDGDLDLVMNNVADEAFVYENRTIAHGNNPDEQPGFLRITLNGSAGNLFGVGAKVLLYNQGTVQLQECMPTRGYQSAVDYRLTFGTGRHRRVDSLSVIWNDGAYQTLYDVRTSRPLVLYRKEASGMFDYSVFHKPAPMLVNASDELAIPYRHKENKFIEFNREGLLPHMLSAEGPASAVADVNGDGREDIYLGGGKWMAGRLFIQKQDGKFYELPQPAFKTDSTYEDVDAVFFDADGDKDLDLFVVSGGNEFSGGSVYQKQRLYVNDGRGNLERSEGIPGIFITGSCVRVCDIDHDGDPDLFLGARAVPWRYGLKPDSHILYNDGKGNFTDVTDDVAPALRQFGFVKNAAWTDIDADGDEDLVIAAEWRPITILLNDSGRLQPLPPEGSGLENTNGWWNIIIPADFDHDGDIDLIAGNLGLNSKLRASQHEPVRMFVSDFDNNDHVDQVLTHFVNGKEYPFYTRDEMTKQMPYLKKKYLSYHVFSQASVYDMFSKDTLAAAGQYTAYTFETLYVENLGNGKFRARPLPTPVQWSPVNAALVDDLNDDGHPDVLLGGNFYPANIQMGRYDASFGLLLLGDGKGGFKAVPAAKSGFCVGGETRTLKKIKVNDKVYYLAIRNNDTVEAFALKAGK